MATTSVSVDIPASAEHVWQVIGGFDALPDWLPYIPVSISSDGGRVRSLENDEGGVIVERLETFDQRLRSYSYSIIEAPFPVTDYIATLAVHDGPGGVGARVEWSGTFTPVGVSDAEAETLFHGIFTDGLAALKQTMAA